MNIRTYHVRVSVPLNPLVLSEEFKFATYRQAMLFADEVKSKGYQVSAQWEEDTIDVNEALTKLSAILRGE